MKKDPTLFQLPLIFFSKEVIIDYSKLYKKTELENRFFMHESFVLHNGSDALFPHKTIYDKKQEIFRLPNPYYKYLQCTEYMNLYIQGILHKPFHTP